MVNHVRTLLLNETQASLGAAGYPYGEPWYVSPAFDSVRVPAGLSRFRDAIFFDTQSLDDRIYRVNAVIPFVEAPDLADQYSVLDARSTVPVASASVSSVREIFDGAKLASNGFEGRVILVAKGSPDLFSSVKDGTLDKAVSDLGKMALGSFESSVRVGASILAYCIQLEAVRTGIRNG